MVIRIGKWIIVSRWWRKRNRKRGSERGSIVVDIMVDVVRMDEWGVERWIWHKVGIRIGYRDSRGWVIG